MGMPGPGGTEGKGGRQKVCMQLTPSVRPLWLLRQRKAQQLVPCRHLAGSRLQRQLRQVPNTGSRRAGACWGQCWLLLLLLLLLLMGCPTPRGISRDCERRGWKPGSNGCRRHAALHRGARPLPLLALGPPAAQRLADDPRNAGLLGAAVPAARAALHDDARRAGVTQAAGHRLPAAGERALGALEAALPLLLAVQAHHPEHSDAADADEGQDAVRNLPARARYGRCGFRIQELGRKSRVGGAEALGTCLWANRLAPSPSRLQALPDARAAGSGDVAGLQVFRA